MTAECFICYETLHEDRQPVAPDCGHVCCKPCLTNWINRGGNVQALNGHCPVCRQVLRNGVRGLRSVYLRFRDDEEASTPGPSNLDEVLKTGRSLLTDLQSLNTGGPTDIDGLRTALADAEQLKSTLQRLFNGEELKVILRNVSVKITEIREGLRAQEQVAALTEALHQSRAQSLQYQNSLQNHAATLLAERRRAEALDQALEAWRARAHNEHAASTQRLVAQKEEMDLRRTMEISELQHKLDDQKQALAEAVKTEQMLKGNILEMKRKIAKRSRDEENAGRLQAENEKLRQELKAMREAYSARGGSVREATKENFDEIVEETDEEDDDDDDDIIILDELPTLAVRARSRQGRSLQSASSSAKRRRLGEDAKVLSNLGNSSMMVLGPKRSRRAP